MREYRITRMYFQESCSNYAFERQYHVQKGMPLGVSLLRLDQCPVRKRWYKVTRRLVKHDS